MTAPARVSDRDLRALAGIVSEDRPDVPAEEGLPPSLLADLMSQIRCDVIAFGGFDSSRRQAWSTQFMPDGGEVVVADADPVNWEYYWHCQPCSHPDRTSDLRSIVKIADFYSARQWHSIGTRCGINRPMGFEHALMSTLPAPPAPDHGPGRTMRLFFFRGPGRDFSERDRALLTLLRPHLHQAYLDAERRRHPIPRLTPGNGNCCAWSPPGSPTPRSPTSSAWQKEPCASTLATSTKDCMYPAALPPSPVRSRASPPRNACIRQRMAFRRQKSCG